MRLLRRNKRTQSPARWGGDNRTWRSPGNMLHYRDSGAHGCEVAQRLYPYCPMKESPPRRGPRCGWPDGSRFQPPPVAIGFLALTELVAVFDQEAVRRLVIAFQSRALGQGI